MFNDSSTCLYLVLKLLSSRPNVTGPLRAIITPKLLPLRSDCRTRGGWRRLTPGWSRTSRSASPPSPQRHPEREPRLLCRRADLQRAAVGAGDLRGDVEAEAQALLAGAEGGAGEGLEEALLGGGGDRVAPVGDGELEAGGVGVGVDADGSAGGAVGEGVGEEVGEELGDPGAVAVDGAADGEAGLDGAVGPGGLELGDNLLEDGAE